MSKRRHAPEKYDAVAAVYDQRWQRYHAETLSRVAGHVVGGPAPRILDAPCGTGELIRWLRPRLPDAHLVGVDGSVAMLRVARAKWHGEGRVTFHQAMVEALPFEDSVFDWVVCCSSFHYFHRPERILAEFTRVLKPTGRLLILDWCRDLWHCRLVNWWKVRFDPTHVWMYTTRELVRLLEDVGLSVGHMERFRVSWFGRVKLWGMMDCMATRADGQGSSR